MKNSAKKIIKYSAITIALTSLLLKVIPEIKKRQIKKTTNKLIDKEKTHRLLTTPINILSANVRNGRDGLEESINKVVSVFENKKEENIYCLQESAKNYVNILKNELGKEYNIIGDYRLGNILELEYNEGNPIITNMKVIKTKTFHLSWIPTNIITLIKSLKEKSIIPRIAVLAVLENRKKEKIICLNTHLNHRIPTIQKIQLDEIYTIINSVPKEYPIIITGDFNLEPGNIIFDSFKKQLKLIGIEEITNSENTYKGNRKKTPSILDHVFYRGVNLTSKIIKTNKKESDHNFILIKSIVKI